MSEVTKPIALDESFKTTEATPRNIADVLADALGSGNTLSGLNDVVINSVTLSNNQTLMYDSLAGKWVNADGVRTWQGTQAEYNAIPNPDPAVTYYITDSTSVQLNLNDLANVSTSSLNNTDILQYNNGTWVNKPNTASNFADAYDPTATYNTGDVCIYNNVLYICTEDNTTGTWDATKWTATTVQSLIGSLSSLTTTNKDSLVDAVNEVNGKLTVETDTYNIATYGGYVKCLKYGNMVTIMLVDFGTTQAPATGAAYTLANIASKYRPAVNLRVDGYANYSSYKYDGMQGYAVNSDGSIVTYNYGTPAITKGNFIVTFIKE